MILNPTHEITLSGLPSEVLDAYVRYKKGRFKAQYLTSSLTDVIGSRAIVAWLVQYSSSRHRGVKTLPLKELASLARTVSTQIKQVPDVIHFHFRETIAARKHLSRFFRQNVDKSEQEVDTVNHEHFTNSLTDIYSEICEQCRATQAARAALSRRLEANSRPKGYGNHYDRLNVEDIRNDDDQYSPSTIAAAGECSQCQIPVEADCHTANPEIYLEDDEMSLTIEYALLAEQARHNFDAVKQCWIQAGKNDVSFLAATIVTNIALSLLRDLGAKLKQLHPTISVSLLYSKCNFQPSSAADGDLQDYHQDLLRMLQRLGDTEKTIDYHLDRNRSSVVKPAIPVIQKLSEFGLHGECDNDFRALQLTILDNMENLASTLQCKSKIMHSSMPMIADMSPLWSHQKGEQTLQSTFNLHLLSTSYCHYSYGSPISTVISSCRIRALQLASAAAASIRIVLSDKSSFPCQCPQTLAYHLSNLQYDLESYAKYRCWDIYSQSPWVAGNHIIEMLDMLSYYGMRLCHYRHFIAAVLHTYNVLCTLANFDKVAMMEELYVSFGQVLFPGGNRPVSSFRNSWSRFVGARLKFRKGHQAASHRESWCMAIPAHAAKVAAGLGSEKKGTDRDTKFDYGSISQVINLKQRNYHIDENEILNRLNGVQASSPPKSKQKKQRSNPKTSEHFLLQLLTNINSEFQPKPNQTSSGLPQARINMIAIFTSCVSIINKISRAIHTAPEDKNTHNCICFVTTLLAAGDRITEGRKLGKLECWKKEERELVDICKKAIKEVMDEVENNKKLWLWDI